VTVRYAKRGRTRAIPLDQDALAALAAWVKARPTAASEHLLLSLPPTGQPPRALTTRDVARIVARHAAGRRPPEGRRTPHVLRHTFDADADADADAGANVRHDPRARRPRRHPHDHDLHRRQRRPPRTCDRRAHPPAQRTSVSSHDRLTRAHQGTHIATATSSAPAPAQSPACAIRWSCTAGRIVRGMGLYGRAVGAALRHHHRSADCSRPHYRWVPSSSTAIEPPTRPALPWSPSPS
jgi:hypothetical protein